MSNNFLHFLLESNLIPEERLKKLVSKQAISKAKHTQTAETSLKTISKIFASLSTRRESKLMKLLKLYLRTQKAKDSEKRP